MMLVVSLSELGAASAGYDPRVGATTVAFDLGSGDDPTDSLHDLANRIDAFLQGESR